MSDRASPIVQSAEDLRRKFDESFADACRAGSDSHEDFIAIQLASDSYAIRLSEISGLFAGKRITSVPGSVAGQLGVASFRGTIVPVFDLSVLLGCNGAEPCRWLVVVRGAEHTSLAFNQFEGHLRISQSAMPTLASPGYIRQVLSVEGRPLPVLHLPSILDEIEKRARSGPQKER